MTKIEKVEVWFTFWTVELTLQLRCFTRWVWPQLWCLQRVLLVSSFGVFSSSEDKFSMDKFWLHTSTCIGVGRWLTPKVLLEPICYDLLDVSLERNLFPDDQSSDLKGVQFDLAKTDHSLWLGVRDKPFFAAVDLLKVKDQVCLSLIFICVNTIHQVVVLPSQLQRLPGVLSPNLPIVCSCTFVLHLK